MATPAALKRLLYFDPFNGASGDMVLGALVDLGLPVDYLKKELTKLNLEKFDIHAEPVTRHGLKGTNLHVHVHAHANAYHHYPPAHHFHSRGFEEIRQLIEKSELDAWIKEKSIAIFRRLGEAEAKVHQCSLEKVHFHEVGAVDAVVDIVGACVGFKHFEAGRFYTAPLNLGGGTVTFSHGTWPVPAPATAELVQGFPVYLGKVEAELTTPTGAAIVTTLAERSSDSPALIIEKTGYGAGDREFPGIPNMLRLILARPRPEQEVPEEAGTLHRDEVTLLEANIDDMDAEMFGYFLDLALQKGALDVYYVPIHMKKSRPGTLLSLLCRPEDRDRMAELIFQETTTLGIRWGVWKRWTLDREVKDVETEYGPVRVKIGRFQGRVINVSPEYEDLKRVAEQQKLPLKVVRQKVLECLRSFI